MVRITGPFDIIELKTVLEISVAVACLHIQLFTVLIMRCKIEIKVNTHFYLLNM